MRPAAFWSSLSSTWRWRTVLGLAALLLVLWLLDAHKPWEAMKHMPGKWDTGDYVRIYGWAAGVINVVILGALIGLCPWWAGPLQTRPLPVPRRPRWFWPLVIAAMAMTLFHSLPRMNDGFWDDEDLNIRTTLYGKFKDDPKTHEVRFVKYTWLDSVYGYKKGPNSHTLFTIFSRACEEAWNAISPPKGFPLVEWPFRVPALICGALAVVALAWLLADLGLPGAGVVAAWLLGVHPWLIRYASEARGYSMLVLLVPLVFVFWRRAMLTGRWVWWGAFAATEFALIYCYPGALFVLVLLNVISLALFLRRRDGVDPRRTQAGRWFFANAAAAMVTLQLMLPLYPQGKAYFEIVGRQGFVAGWSWVGNTVSFMLGGAPWAKSSSPFDGYPEWLAREMVHPVLFAIAVILASAFILAGAFTLARRGWPGAALVAATFICPLVTFTLAWFKKFLLYECYVIYSLPGLVACAAAGVVVLALALQRMSGTRTAAPAFAALVVAGFFASTAGFRTWLAVHPLQQVREAVIFSRGTLDPWSPWRRDVLTASFCIPPELYDARVDRLDSARDLIEELHRADRENKPLLLNIGMPWAAQEYNPQMWRLFTSPDLFDKPARLRGFEPSLDRLVACYKPHSADHFDFSAIQPDAR